MLFGKCKKQLYVYFIGGNCAQFDYTPEAYEKLSTFLGESNFEGVTHINKPETDKDIFINWKNVAYTEWK